MTINICTQVNKNVDFRTESELTLIKHENNSNNNEFKNQVYLSWLYTNIIIEIQQNVKFIAIIIFKNR